MEALYLDATYRTNKLKMPLLVLVVQDGPGTSHALAFQFVSCGQQCSKNNLVRRSMEFMDLLEECEMHRYRHGDPADQVITWLHRGSRAREAAKGACRKHKHCREVRRWFHE